MTISLPEDKLKIIEFVVEGVSEAARKALVLRDVSLKSIRLVDGGIEGPTAYALFEIVLEARHRGQGSLRFSLSLSGGMIDAEAVSEALGDKTRIVVKVRRVFPSSLLRDEKAVKAVSNDIANMLLDVVNSVQLLLRYPLGTRRVKPKKGREECMDPGEGLLRLLDMLVDAYGVVKGMELFDEYLEKPGVIEVDGVVVYPRLYSICFRLSPHLASDDD